MKTADFDFHTAVIDLADHRRLREHYRSLHAQTRLYLNLTATVGYELGEIAAKLRGARGRDPRRRRRPGRGARRLATTRPTASASSRCSATSSRRRGPARASSSSSSSSSSEVLTSGGPGAAGLEGLDELVALVLVDRGVVAQQDPLGGVVLFVLDQLEVHMGPSHPRSRRSRSGLKYVPGRVRSSSTSKRRRAGMAGRLPILARQTPLDLGVHIERRLAARDPARVGRLHERPDLGA